MARRSCWLHDRPDLVTSCQRHLHVHVHTSLRGVNHRHTKNESIRARYCVPHHTASQNHNQSARLHLFRATLRNIPQPTRTSLHTPHRPHDITATHKGSTASQPLARGIYTYMYTPLRGVNHRHTKYERSDLVTSCQRHLDVHVHIIAWRQPSPHKIII